MKDDGSGRDERDLHTLGIHGGAEPPRWGAPVVPPIVQSSAFYGGMAGDDVTTLYSRYGKNPNQARVGAKVASLEGMEAGLALGSGMAAIALTSLALTRSGDHVVASRYLYGVTRGFMEIELPRRGVEVTFIDPARENAWREALRPSTRFLYLEIPTNPTLRVFDPGPPARLAREKGLPLVADATFASPVNFRAREHGVDLVIHSATKYLGGHTDLLAGVVCGREELVARVARLLSLYGPVLDPHAAWLLDRGLRTLGARMERQNASAEALARWFQDHPRVEEVHYPALESHPDHEVARRVLQGFGGMLAVVVQGSAEGAERFCRGLRLAVPAPTLGGVETMVVVPRLSSHAGIGAEEREALGIPDGLVRISVGLEGVEDLRSDFQAALDRI